MRLKHEFDVLAGDTSQHMLAQARAFSSAQNPISAGAPVGSLTFAQIGVMATGLPSQSVDVTICNRLLHHYATSELRRERR